MAKGHIFPTHEFQGFKVRDGFHQPIGAMIVPGGVNFSIFSHHASSCALLLYEKGASMPMVEIPFQGFFFNLRTSEMSWEIFRIGKLFSMVIFDIPCDQIEYGFRFEGEEAPKLPMAAIHRFDSGKVLLDPYAKAIGGRDLWGVKSESGLYSHRARIVQEDFDWESDRQLELPIEELIIYEMHVRGFTRHPSSRVASPGTFSAIADKIPYLKELGINCVELMPIAEFDEFENHRHHPESGEPLLNYWGYSPIGFFAPKAGYAACGRNNDGTAVVDELKELVKELHANGIEVILDVVFNHTAEGNEYGPTISFKGIDNAIYYMLTPEGFYHNFSGTGNTFNCNNPIVRNVLLDCLRYWVAEYHIDGFRFDLAAILGRDQDGVPLANPPLLETLSFDPILAKCKLIAESWDAAGLYQVGTFPAYGRWAEWNGHYRDVMRKFVKGEKGQIYEMAQCFQGSPHLYQAYNKTASVNFITCHDGFTLWDLVSYNEKHNEDNGEGSRDGCNQNYSWNCGVEGATQDREINLLRRRQVKNFLLLLFVSQGVPMLTMGDEMGRTQHGNNNAYCQDSENYWLNWDLLKENEDIFTFVKGCIALRRRYPMLLTGSSATLTWHCSFNDSARFIAFTLCDTRADEYHFRHHWLYVAANMEECCRSLSLPQLPAGMAWYILANSGMEPPEDIWPLGSEVLVENHDSFILGARSSCLLIGK